MIYTQKETLSPSVGKTHAKNEDTKALVNDLQKKADKTNQETIAIFRKGLLVDSRRKMGDLYNEFSNNPSKLNEEFKSLQDDIISSISSPKIQVDTIADLMLVQSAYLNKANRNLKHETYATLKRTNAQKMDINLELMKNSFGNLVSNEKTTDDYVNYMRSLTDNNLLIETKNSDGSFMYSEAQRKHLKNQTEKEKLSSLKEVFNQLPAFEKGRFYQKLAKDEIIIFENEKEKVNLKDTIEPETYKRFKENTTQIIKRAKSLQITKGLMSQDTAYQVATEWQENEQEMKKKWDLIHNRKTRKQKKEMANKAKVLNYRQELSALAKDGRIEKEVYKNLLGETAQELELEEDKNSSLNPLDNLTVTMNVIKKQIQNKNISSFNKAFLWDNVYKKLTELQIDPTAEFGDYPDEVNAVAQHVIKGYTLITNSNEEKNIFQNQGENL